MHLTDNEPDAIDLKECTSSKSAARQFQMQERSAALVAAAVVAATQKPIAKEIRDLEPVIDLDDSDNVEEHTVEDIEMKDEPTAAETSDNKSLAAKLNGNSAERVTVAEVKVAAPKLIEQPKIERQSVEVVDTKRTSDEISKPEEYAASVNIDPNPIQTNGIDKDEPASSAVVEEMIVDTDATKVPDVPKLPSESGTAIGVAATDTTTATTTTNTTTTTATNIQNPIEPNQPLEQQNSAATRKRTRSASPPPATINNCSTADNDAIPPSKRLRMELEQNFGAHDKVLRNYIEKTSNNNLDEIQQHVDELLADIHELTELSRAKEAEWNAILHTIKIKEEIVVRLKRKKNVMEIMSKKVGEVNDYSILDQQPSLSKKITKEIPNSLMMNSTMNSVTMVPLLSSTPASNAAKIIQNRTKNNHLDPVKDSLTAARIER